MTRGRFRVLRRIQRWAAAFAALGSFGLPLAAEEVTLRSTGGLVVTGEVLAFDGTYLRLGTAAGEVTIDYAAVTCEGAACPDPVLFVPVVRVSGARRIADILLPALIEGFGRERGLAVTRVEQDASHFRYTLAQGGAERLTFAFRSTTTDEGFADLLANEADIALAVREVRPEEAVRAHEIGLGRLETAGRSRIIALDAILPIASVAQPVRSISLDGLASAFAGEFEDWRALGGPPAPLSLHLAGGRSGLAQGFLDRVLRVSNREMDPGITRHAGYGRVSQSVAADRSALGIVPFGAEGNALTLALEGSCGRRITADRATLKTGDYPLTQPLFLYLPMRRLPPLADDFLIWLRSAEAQRIVRRAGFVDRAAERLPLDRQGARLAQAIAAAGPEIGLAELQEMIRTFATRDRLTTTFRFEPGSTRLTAQSRSDLLQLARSVREGRFAGEALLLAGFTDGIGAADANRDLSEARARAVRREIVAALGGALPQDLTLSATGFGEALPIGCDDTEWGRQMNRRVELWIPREG